MSKASEGDKLSTPSQEKEPVDISLCPYSLIQAKHIKNCLPYQEYGTSRLEIFTGSKIATNIRDNNSFGCTVYDFHNQLQEGGRISKWNPGAKMGLYLGPSTRHARSLYLVMNMYMDTKFPQFCVQNEKFFETLHPTTRKLPKLSQWKQLSGFSKTGDINYRCIRRDQIHIRSL